MFYFPQTPQKNHEGWTHLPSLPLCLMMMTMMVASLAAGPDHLPRRLRVQEGNSVHDGTRLRAEVQGRIQEAVLLDAGEKKVLQDVLSLSNRQRSS